MRSTAFAFSHIMFARPTITWVARVVLHLSCYACCLPFHSLGLSWHHASTAAAACIGNEPPAPQDVRWLAVASHAAARGGASAAYTLACCRVAPCGMLPCLLYSLLAFQPLLQRAISVAQQACLSNPACYVTTGRQCSVWMDQNRPS